MPVLQQLASDPDRLVVAIHCPQLTPAQVFDCFVIPDLLALWWPPQAEIEPRVGGSYHLFWAGQDWHLRGYYTAFARGVLCYGRWMRDTEDPIADLARIAGAPPGLFRTIDLDPVERERAVFASRVGGNFTRHTVELTVDLSSVVARMNQVLADAGVDRRIYGVTTDAGDLYVARTPDEVEKLRAEVPGLVLFTMNA